jgi:hypothetical protein
MFGLCCDQLWLWTEAPEGVRIAHLRVIFGVLYGKCTILMVSSIMKHVSPSQVSVLLLPQPFYMFGLCCDQLWLWTEAPEGVRIAHFRVICGVLYGKCSFCMDSWIMQHVSPLQGCILLLFQPFYMLGLCCDQLWLWTEAPEGVWIAHFRVICGVLYGTYSFCMDSWIMQHVSPSQVSVLLLPQPFYMLVLCCDQLWLWTEAPEGVRIAQFRVIFGVLYGKCTILMDSSI